MGPGFDYEINRPMSLLKFCVLLVGLAGSILASRGQQSPVNRAWPPGVQPVSKKSPALSPEEALQTFHMPPGFRVELVASEPLVRDPIMIDWDAHGRLWVAELPVYVPDLQTPEPNLDPACRVVVLQDTDGDGRMDKRTVFADGLVQLRAIKVLDHGVLVAEPPNIWLMRDTDGDLRMDSKEVVATGYGSRDGNVELNANSLYWGMDNWIHTTLSDITLRFKAGRFEIRKTLATAGQWGVSQDDFGRLYRNRNESALHVDLVPTPYFARNPNLLRRRGMYEDLRDANNALNVVWPARPNPGTNRAYQYGIDRPDGSLAKFTSNCAPLVYRGDRLPAELYGNVFIPEPAANVVSRIVLEDDGATLRARKAYERGEFLASTDERFRPVWLSNAPDGALYIVDLYRGVIQQRVDITEYLRDYIVKHDLEKPIGLGRIYRVAHESTQRDRTPAVARASAMELIAALAHPNGWRRDTAQQLLVQRGDKSVVPALARLSVSAGELRTRLHALWTLDGLDGIEPDAIKRLLGDAAPPIRAAAIRIAERWLAEANHPLQAAVRELVDDQSVAVRRQLAASLGALPPGIREPAVLALLERHANDPITMDAALSGLRGSESAVLSQLIANGGGQTPEREVMVTMLSAMVFRIGQDATAREIFSTVADAQGPGWLRSALLRGAEMALLGASLGGPLPPPVVKKIPCPVCGVNPAGPGGGPCLTCPGGRGGPGGAFAFRPVQAAPRPAPGSTLRVNREPIEFSRLAAAPGELERRAAAVLARVEWPGKPGAVSIVPLTADEQSRFEAGRIVYQNLCQACHQADGRGQDNVAPSLVESALALAAPEITARILLNGKEGRVGLMPPVGSVLTDEKIAEVLTFIRREWGQAGAPVKPATVKSVRALTVNRPRPWTNDELVALPEAAGLRREAPGSRR